MDGWAGCAVGEKVDQRHRGGGSQKSNPSNERGVEDRRIEGMIVIGSLPLPPPPCLPSLPLTGPALGGGCEMCLEQKVGNFLFIDSATH